MSTLKCLVKTNDKMYQIIKVIGSRKRLYQKICLIMRLTTVIMIACLMQVSAAGLAQKITLNERNTPLNNVLRTIGKQSGFAVYFDGKSSLKSQKVTVVVNNASIEEALDQAFKNLEYTYQIDGKTIAIKPKEEANFFERILERLQAIDVTGKIVDESGRPIPGASIKVKGKNTMTSSNDQGTFLLKNVEDNAILEISFIGYQFKEVKASRDIGSIRMEIEVGKLNEVTVNAGYYSVKERELTGSISRVSSKDIENQPVTNVLATMQGRMAGVNITQNTGMPGSGFNIEIRGQNSLRFNGSRPLYIIDGVPYSAQDIGSTYTSGNMPQNNSPLNSINPGDIESIEVLKDADATAIYGSRGANGVVLITTKKGATGKTSFVTNYTSGFGRVAHFKDMMETPSYLSMRREAFANDGITQLPTNAYDVNGTWDQNRNTNWQKELIGGTATYNNVQSSLSGGSAKTQFLLSGNYNRETTVFPGNFEFVKAGGHLNINHESENKRFRLNFSGSSTLQSSNMPSIDITQAATRLSPNAPLLYDQFGKLNWENNTFANPLSEIQGVIEGNTRDLLASSLVSYTIAEGLMLKSSLGYTTLDQKQLNLLPSTIYNPSSGLGSEASSVFTNNIARSSWIVEPQLTWKRNLTSQIALDALVGATLQEQKENRFVNLGTGFGNNSQMRNPASAATTRVLSSEESLYKYEAFFTRVNLNWAGKYLLNLTARRDGSSRFGPGKKFGNFGAVGMAWLFADEKWIKDEIPFLSFGKLRASYGTSGNDQIGDYQYLDSYSTSGNTYQGIAGIQPSRLFNPDFGWEINKKMEVALETGFLKDRIFTTIGWFQNRSSSQLVGLPLPATTGFSSIQANLDAVVQNKGIEVTIETKNIKKDKFEWTSSFNFTRAQNKLVSFPGLETSTYSAQYVIGQSLNISQHYQFIGVNPTTGIYQFKDFNNDGIINTTDRKVIKDRNPKFFSGLHNQLNFNGLAIDFLFHFVKQDNFNENFGNLMPGTMNNQPTIVTSRWQKAGDIAPYQGYSNSNGAKILANSQFTGSDAGVSDASYIRLKNVSLTYQLPKDWTKKFTCKISLQGQNVFTITKYGGVDPEFRVAGYLPPLRVYTSSIQLIF